MWTFLSFIVLYTTALSTVIDDGESAKWTPCGHENKGVRRLVSDKPGTELFPSKMDAMPRIAEEPCCSCTEDPPWPSLEPPSQEEEQDRFPSKEDLNSQLTGKAQFSLTPHTDTCRRTTAAGPKTTRRRVPSRGRRTRRPQKAVRTLKSPATERSSRPTVCAGSPRQQRRPNRKPRVRARPAEKPHGRPDVADRDNVPRVTTTATAESSPNAPRYRAGRGNRKPASYKLYYIRQYGK